MATVTKQAKAMGSKTLKVVGKVGGKALDVVGSKAFGVVGFVIDFLEPTMLGDAEWHPEYPPEDSYPPPSYYYVPNESCPDDTGKPNP